MYKFEEYTYISYFSQIYILYIASIQHLVPHHLQKNSSPLVAHTHGSHMNKTADTHTENINLITRIGSLSLG